MLKIKESNRVHINDLEYLAIEQGIGVSQENVRRLSELLLQEYNEKPKTDKPYIFFVSGHAGSGKTTVSNYLAAILDATVIHSDRIRGILKDEGFEYFGSKLPLVSAVRNEVIRLVADGRNIVIDQFINPVRYLVINEIVCGLRRNYRPVSIYLHASEEIRKRRLAGRVDQVGYNTSKVEAMTLQGNVWNPSTDAFDIVFDTERLNEIDIFTQLRKLVNDYEYSTG